MRAFLMSLFLAGTVLAQTPPSAKEIAESLKDGYNGTNPAVFSKFFNTELRSKETDRRILGFIKNAVIGWGKIKELGEPKQMKDGTVEVPAIFDKARTILILAMDATGKLASYEFRDTGDIDFADPPKASVFFRFPFKGIWTVAQGGDSREQNIHHDIPTEAFSFDFLRLTDAKGTPVTGIPASNADSPQFGQEVLAPAKGYISQLIDTIPDNSPGKPNAFAPDGNSLALCYAPNEFVVMSHLKNGAFKVRAGEAVEPGQLLALTGNSGDSLEPMSTFSVRNGMVGQKSKTVKALKAGFACVEVSDGTAWIRKVNYYPVKGDILRICPEEPQKP